MSEYGFERMVVVQVSYRKNLSRYFNVALDIAYGRFKHVITEERPSLQGKNVYFVHVIIIGKEDQINEDIIRSGFPEAGIYSLWHEEYDYSVREIPREEWPEWVLPNKSNDK